MRRRERKSLQQQLYENKAVSLGGFPASYSCPVVQAPLVRLKREQVVTMHSDEKRTDPTEFEKLRNRVLRDKDILDEKVESGQLDEVEFAHQVNDLMGRYLESASHILSREDFEEYFGEPYNRNAKPVLVDPEIAALNRRSRGAHS
jgi:hypothetical protein